MPKERRISLVERLRELTVANPEHIAVSVGDGGISRGELETRSDATARELIHLGVRTGAFVCLVLPNGLEFVAGLVAVWKAGAVPVPLSPRLTRTELDGLLDLLDPAAVIGGTAAEVGGRPALPAGHRPEPRPEIVLNRSVVSPCWKAIGSGGSTGRPKLIVTAAPVLLAPQDVDSSPLGLRCGDVSIITAPLSHNGPLISLVHTLLLGGRAVLTGRFDPEQTLATVEREGASWLYLVPTMMGRIWKLPAEVRDRYDLTALREVVHLGAPCPMWLKQAWVDWLGPDRLLEMCASTEALVLFTASGREWLERPGTVGLPRGGVVQIRALDGAVLPAGDVGRVWLRRAPEMGPSYHYLGAASAPDPDGWETAGDIGRLDADGYLYIEDREAHMVLVGGTNVYPAEIEAALLAHPAVADCCVIGLPHDDLGQAPHAIVHASAEIDTDELGTLADERLSPYKQPRSYEFVDAPLRGAAGKVRRAQLRAARVVGAGSAA